eukprot:21260-Chlamydomonas_euryale.AAC.4
MLRLQRVEPRDEELLARMAQRGEGPGEARPRPQREVLGPQRRACEHLGKQRLVRMAKLCVHPDRNRHVHGVQPLQPDRGIGGRCRRAVGVAVSASAGLALGTQTRGQHVRGGVEQRGVAVALRRARPQQLREVVRRRGRQPGCLVAAARKAPREHGQRKAGSAARHDRRSGGGGGAATSTTSSVVLLFFVVIAAGAAAGVGCRVLRIRFSLGGRRDQRRWRGLDAARGGCGGGGAAAAAAASGIVAHLGAGRQSAHDVRRGAVKQRLVTQLHAATASARG